MLRHTILLTTFALALFCSVASAALPEGVAEDFAPLSGFVIMPVGGEYLIDQDASKGVASGDLFAVVKPGEKIVHPVTKEVLGSLDELKGILQVTRLKSGYAYARALGEAGGIERGDVIRRYEGVTATFWDYTGGGEPLFTELQEALPHLDWRDYAAAQAGRPATPAAPADAGAALFFVLGAGGLEVRDGTFEALRAYRSAAPTVMHHATAVPAAPALPAASVPVAPAAVAPALEARLQALEEKLQQPAPGSAPFRLETPAEPATGMRFAATFPGFDNLGNLDGATVMADFARDGERLLMASTDGRTIAVHAVSDKLDQVAGGDTGYVAQLLSVRWWRPAAGSDLYLAVSAWSEPRVESALFALRGDQLVAVQEHIPYLLGAFDRDGDGSPETLLGQSFDRSNFFGRDIRAMRLAGGELRSTDLSFDLPDRFTVQGSLMADLTGDGRSETICVLNGRLRIYAGEKELYRSHKQMGGTLSVATYETNPGARESIPDYAPFEVPPVAADLDGDGTVELVAVASDRSFMSAPGISPGVKKSWLAVIKFRDNMFMKGSIGGEMEVPLQGVGVDGERLLFVASEPASVLGQGGGSHLLAFPLAQ